MHSQSLVRQCRYFLAKKLCKVVNLDMVKLFKMDTQKKTMMKLFKMDTQKQTMMKLFMMDSQKKTKMKLFKINTQKKTMTTDHSIS